MKKVFVDIYLAFNLGDDLFLDILAKKYPNCSFTVNYVGNNYDEFLSHYSNVERRKYTLLNKISQKLNIKDYLYDYGKIAEEHDAIVFIGGSIFREEDYHKSLYEDRMRMIKEFKKRDKSVFVLGANFGPVKTNSFVSDYMTFFKLCDDVCFRDCYSYEIFKELPQVRYAPDIVFQMSIEKYKRQPKNKVVGYSIIDVNHKSGLKKYEQDYISSTAKSIKMFIEKGYECCLMSFCEKEGDLNVIEEITSKLPKSFKDKIYVYEYDGKLDESLSLISSFDLFVAARFHANIIALLLDIGVLPVIYSEKTSNMLKDIGKSDLLIDMENLRLMYEEDIIDLAINNKADLSIVIQKSKKQFEKLSKFIMEEKINLSLNVEGI